MYGLLAKYSPFHLPLNQNCTQCGVCANHCTYYGGPYEDYLKSECLACMNCLSDCPFAAIDVRFGLPRAGQIPALVPRASPQRRKILAAIGCGLAVAAMPQITAAKKQRPTPLSARPAPLPKKTF